MNGSRLTALLVIQQVLYVLINCIVGILCSSSNANHIPLHVCLVYMYMYMAIKLSIYLSISVSPVSSWRLDVRLGVPPDELDQWKLLRTASGQKSVVGPSSQDQALPQ